MIQAKNTKHFRSVYPFVRPRYAEVIRSFVADKSSEQLVDIDAILLVLPNNSSNIQDIIGNGHLIYSSR
jgi:hypothetical protein